jgi:light-dependent protochlorophyllide reductase
LANLMTVVDLPAATENVYKPISVTMETTTENGSAKPSTDDQKPTDAVETTQQVPAESDATPAPMSGDDATAAPTSEQTPSQPDDAAASNATETEAVAAAPTVVPRVVIVTGASSGLGFEVAKTLCEVGHDVILACRNEEKTNRAIEKIRKQNPKAQATFMPLDLASLETVRKFVENFHATGKKLSVLINNAGVGLNFKDTKRQYTKDNFELTLGTNHLGHFLLTNLLLNDLKATASEGGDARIVVISSGMHDAELSKKRGPVQPLDMENLFLLKDGTYSGLQAYKNSKVANLLFTYELSRQLEGTGIKVNAIDPGFVPTTEFLRHASAVQKFFTRYVLHGMLRFTKATRTVSQAGSVICNVATGDKFKDTNGKYIRDGAEVKSSDESLDEEKQKKLWELSGGYTHLEGFEPLDAPTPPPEPVKEEPKQEQKPEETANGDATKADPVDSGNKVSDDTNKETEVNEKTDLKISDDTNKKIEEQDVSDNNKVSDDTNNAEEKPETQEKADDDNKTEEKKDAEKDKEEEKKEPTENKD